MHELGVFACRSESEHQHEHRADRKVPTAQDTETGLFESLVGVDKVVYSLACMQYGCVVLVAYCVADYSK